MNQHSQKPDPLLIEATIREIEILLARLHGIPPLPASSREALHDAVSYLQMAIRCLDDVDLQGDEE